MRFNEAPISRSLLPPVQAALRRNDQLQRSSSEVIINEKANALTRDFESQEFHIGQDTTNYSSFALARSNKILEHNINNNLDNAYQSSSTESLADYEGYYEEPEEPQDGSDEDLSEYSEDANLPAGCRGIVNPNYPGFQHLGPSLLSDVDDTDDEFELTDQTDGFPPLASDQFNNNNNNNSNNNNNNDGNDDNNVNNNCELEEAANNSLNNNERNDNNGKCVNDNESVPVLDETLINRLDVRGEQRKQLFYERPKFNIQKAAPLNESANYENNAANSLPANEIVDAHVEIVHLSTSVNESLQFPEIEEIPDSCKSSEAEEADDHPAHPTHYSQYGIDLLHDAHPLELKKKKQAPPRPPQPLFLPQPRNINAYNPFLNPFITFDEPASSFLSDDLEPPVETPASVAPRLTELDEQQLLAQEVPEKSKLDEIDLLAGIAGRQDQQQTCVPDVVAMQDQLVPMDSPSRDEREEVPQVPTRQDVASKREKMMRNQAARRKQQRGDSRRQQTHAHHPRADQYSNMGAFDVYNIETAMPKIDLDVIESHLKAAREEERRRRNDREEIRRRLAMGPDADELRAEKGRKPSLQSRLQSGMNLQICFMNEHSSDTESLAEPTLLCNNGTIPGSNGSLSSPLNGSASCSSSSASSSLNGSTSSSRFAAALANRQQQQPQRPQMLHLSSLARPSNGALANFPNNNNNNNNNVSGREKRSGGGQVEDEADFFARQARLQTEARLALAQAKEMARMHMQLERQKLRANPITEMVRSSLCKIGVSLGEERRRLTRALLTELNIAQLQVLANDLHARIATLNEELVEGLMLRDDLHMEQDSMLVDVEDLTRYLGAKQESLARIKSRARQPQPRRHQKIQTSTMSLQTRLAAGRQLVASLVRK